MQVHQVERDSTLQISIDPAQSDLIAHVEDSDIAEMGPRDCLVDALVLLDAPKEIALRTLGGHVLVVGIAGGDLERDIGSDDGGVVADRLEEDDGETAFTCDAFFYFSSEKETRLMSF